MTTQPATVADPAGLTLDFQHTTPLLGLSATEIWQVQIRADGAPVGSLRAVLTPYRGGGSPQPGTDSEYSHCTRGELIYEDVEEWFPDVKQLDSLRSRLSAQGGFCAQVAEQLLSEGAVGLREFGSLNVLVFDHLSLSAPWDDPTVAAGVVALVVDQVAVADLLVVFPAGAAAEEAGADLLAAAGSLLWAEQFSDDTQCLDTKFDHGEGVAEVRELLLSRVRR
ncbi:hypothetical protein OHA79_44785 (plasmid) [Streptomyces sp. NBC_00841]|uniref:hypothetical protein n=1 Tax=unclassified Streptomyces TaxID=2593676 RepID=UPI00224F6646|nr:MULTISPECIES: hypothetical protein [unclassified Streptomyces]MCX4538972.1 hypothetical protein [Streptomyces sp. NBC_01669]WSA04796.1 hypothetical protein OHA79_44785 [Streptomyces sp. NBC_00841]